MVRARFGADGETSLHALEVDERYVVTSGRGLMRLGDRTFEVEPGVIVMIPKGTPQSIKNLGEGELEFFCVSTPRFLKDDYVHVG